jgi:hypothetical protein
MAWTRLSHVALSSSGDTIDSGTITACHKLRVIIYGIASSDISFKVRFNGDTGSNYTFRSSLNGGSDGTDTGESYINVGTSFTGTADILGIMDITNKSDKVKIVESECMATQSGAGNAPERKEVVGKWQNTSAQITSITVHNSGSGSYDTGSYITVFGDDEDGTEDEKTTLTNVPVNTRYEETDTRKIFRSVGDTVAILNHDFVSGLSPLTVDSYSSSYISASGGILDCNFPYGSGDSQKNYGVSARYDFGADTVSETNWVLRWKAKCNSFENSGVQFQVGLTDKDHTVYSTGTQTAIACLWQQNTNVYLAQGNNSSSGMNGDDNTATGYGLSNSTYYYFEMKRISATSIGLKIGTSAYGGTEKGNITHTTSSSVDDLRYLTFTKEGRACTADIDEVIFFNNTTTGGTPFEWKERGTA